MILILLTLIIILIIFIDLEQIKLWFYAIIPFKNENLEITPFKKRKIAIITAEDRDFPFIKYHDINFKKYCDIHGYTYIRLDNCPKEESSTYWCKIYKIKQYLPYYDYVMWADSDTIIPDLSKSIDSFISDHGEPDIIIGIDSWFIDIKIICAGLFLIKNSNIGKSFIDDCILKINDKDTCIINGKEQGVWAGICYEQGVMNLLIREKYSKYTYVDTDNTIFKNIPDGLGANYNFDNSIIIHLAGHPNDVRENIFKKYI